MEVGFTQRGPGPRDLRGRRDHYEIQIARVLLARCKNALTDVPAEGTNTKTTFVVIAAPSLAIPGDLPLREAHLYSPAIIFTHSHHHPRFFSFRSIFNADFTQSHIQHLTNVIRPYFSGFPRNFLCIIASKFRENREAIIHCGL